MMDDVTQVRIRKYLDGMKPVRVQRLTGPELEMLGTTPHDCHQNVQGYVIKNKCLGVKHAYGWSVWQAAYLLHSVVKYPDGCLKCITPSIEDGGLRTIMFIEDLAITEKLTSTAEGTLVEPVWNGETVPEEILR